MECYLSPSRLPFAIKCTCFSVLLLWIVCGFYMGDGNTDDAYGMRDITRRRPLAHYRRLLAVSKTDSQMMGVDAYEDEGYLENGSQHFDPDAECSSVHKVPSNQSCHFVLNVSSCQNEDGLINYLEFIYCKLPKRLTPLAMVVLAVWLIFMFIFLGATAEEYFCPSLKVISQVLHLSQNVAGVTLLALGNGAPDIFSAFAAINQKDDHKASLAIGALFGAGIFVTTIVVGAVAFLKPFVLTQRPFLRDVIFYTVAVYWTFYLLWKGSIDIGNAAGLVGLYVFYVVVVIVGRVVYQWWKKRRGKNVKLGNGDIPRPPAPPEGEEMGHSEPSSQTNLLDDTPEDDKSKKTQIPVANGYTSNGSNTDMDTEPSNRPARHYRITSIGSSDLSYSEHQTNTIINVTADDTISSDVPALLSKEQRNELGRMNAPTPPISIPSPGLAPPERKRAGSPYGAVFSDEENIINHRGNGPRQPHSGHKPMRKTISGALDITEEVGAAFGIPHVPQVWEEVHRSHSRNRNITEEEPQESHPAPPTSDEDAPLLMKPPPPVSTPKKMHPFVKMLRAIWPFGPSFKSLSIFAKIYEIVKSPISVMLVLTTPLVDSDEEDHNWNKWLNVFHCAIAPVFIVLVTKRGFIDIGGGFQVWALMLIVGFLVALVVALTSKNDKPPLYHCVFAWIGFAVSVVWIYSIANEIVNLLQAFGVVLKISDGILGLTFLAWGNSIGDAVSNMAMARQGFPRMAIGACFGGPLLNMLLGIGIASIVKSVRRSGDGFQFQLYFSQVEFLASLFLVASLACSLIVITCLRFRLRRPYGIFLIIFYLVFLVVSILAEVKVFAISIPGHVTPDAE